MADPIPPGSPSGLAFDGDPTERQRACDHCGESHPAVHGFVTEDGSAHAVFYADWYPHSSEAYIDVILGTWGDDDYRDQVTFGCRIGPLPGQEAPGASLVQAAAVRPDHPLFGRKLDREAALEHPLLPQFWQVVDWLILTEPMLHANVFHMG